MLLSESFIQSEFEIDMTRNHHHNLTWRDFNLPFYPSSFGLTEEDLEACSQNASKVIELRPFMIEAPHCVKQSVKFDQIVELYRAMNLRHLPVVKDEDNTLVGIITRQDLFAFMHL